MARPKNSFAKDTFRFLVVITAILGLCRVTMGGAALAVALMGGVFAIQRKGGYLAFCYILFPFFTIFNRAIVGISPLFLFTARLGNLFMIAAMMLVGTAFTGSRARERLPIGVMFAYLFVACLSSIDGWMPFISYLKIFQFCFFLIGLYFVTRIVQNDREALYQVRCVFMAFSLIMIVGSLLVKFVPSIGYSMHMSRMGDYQVVERLEDMAQSGGMMLFNGLTSHSQMLPPTIAMLGAWVLCDMIFIERRVAFLHALCLACVPVLLFLSRSRGALLELVAVIFTVFFVCLPKARLSRIVKSRMTQMLFLVIAVLMGVAFVMQLKTQMLSKWLRKTEDVGGDTRSITEAFTESRLLLVDYNLKDFKRNPLLGMGFQVVAGMEQAYRANMITWYSASIEKGVTPYVILGETGIVGAIVFIAFLFVFYGTCLKRRYLSLLTSFTCVLVANLADSTLFSPGGIGGFLWITSCVGAFSTDLLAKKMNQAGVRPFQMRLWGPPRLPPPPAPYPRGLPPPPVRGFPR